MENKEIIEELKSLIQLDIDAARAYSQAIDEVDIKFIRDNLDDFRNDHERHIYNLSPLITELGGTPPDKSPDLKGFVIAGFTMIRSQAGTEGALNAMETNEKLTNKSYSEACSKDFPPNILVQLQNNYDDEQRHLEFIHQQLGILKDNPLYYGQSRAGIETEP
jgi:uncharacterized protein (TIGR02284 family)